MERFQKIEEFLLVPPKNTFDLRRFFRICDKHLAYHSKFNENTCRNAETYFEHVEGLELDVLTFIPKQVHHHFQIGFISDVTRHHIEVGPVKKNLAEQFQRLSLGHVIGREDKGCI